MIAIDERFLEHLRNTLCEYSEDEYQNSARNQMPLKFSYEVDGDDDHNKNKNPSNLRA